MPRSAAGTALEISHLLRDVGCRQPGQGSILGAPLSAGCMAETAGTHIRRIAVRNDLGIAECDPGHQSGAANKSLSCASVKATLLPGICKGLTLSKGGTVAGAGGLTG